MARDPFAFLDSSTKERTLLILLLALIRRNEGEVSLDLSELTSISDGDSFLKYPSDNGAKLVLRFARRGAEAYFLAEDQSQTSARSTSRGRIVTPQAGTGEAPSPRSRHAVHDDLDLALREEEMASRAEQIQRERTRQARAAAGAMPWRTETRQ